MATKADIDRYIEMAKVRDLPKEEICAFYRKQASIERKIRCEEMERGVQEGEREKEREREVKLKENEVYSGNREVKIRN